MSISENETISILELHQPFAYKEVQNAVEMAIQALEEIQEYRAIGTVGEFQHLITAWDELSKLIGIAKNELSQYKSIGTIEEFKALKEKSEPKKPKKERWIYTQCVCGNVFSRLHKDYYYYVPYENKTKYCPKCGQRLDWE